MTEEQQQDEKTLFLLRHLDQADILDMYEVLLCKSNIGLMVCVYFTGYSAIAYCKSLCCAFDVVPPFLLSCNSIGVCGTKRVLVCVFIAVLLCYFDYR